MKLRASYIFILQVLCLYKLQYNFAIYVYICSEICMISYKNTNTCISIVIFFKLYITIFINNLKYYSLHDDTSDSDNPNKNKYTKNIKTFSIYLLDIWLIT